MSIYYVKGNILGGKQFLQLWRLLHIVGKYKL